ncbi:hypothetical protein [Streptomyces sp. IB2014 016-6]|uniref:hypothetical protein n=1 Tax=Streptomyces sp. IB2014 016-6 TaxID=2517818 RepID=UPI0011CB90E6|nr:hypothetical protein [Streptomyces sp. IB2014 016-6]TXL85941.1 hypothetical protein EW053_27980 [Streptomyces sp. IB2014 016-6]
MAHRNRGNANRKNTTGKNARTGENAARTGPAGTSHGTRSELRALRREVPCTVGLLADEQDFATMRRYRTFTFDDHRRYLRQIDGLLRTLATEGAHTSVALFDPEEFAEYCAETGHAPDTVASRGRFTARIAATGGALVPYTGQPVEQLVPQLINTAVRKATWEYATMVLADLGECADCGVDIGRASFDRASRLLTHLIERAGPGTHHLVCSIPTPDEQLLAALHLERPDTGPARLDASESAEFVTVLAAGIALDSHGGVVLRTTRPGAPDSLHGWRLRQSTLAPLSEGQVFSAYCTDADTGEPLSPEPGVEYRAGFDLGIEDPDIHR